SPATWTCTSPAPPPRPTSQSPPGWTARAAARRRPAAPAASSATNPPPSTWSAERDPSGIHLASVLVIARRRHVDPPFQAFVARRANRTRPLDRRRFSRLRRPVGRGHPADLRVRAGAPLARMSVGKHPPTWVPAPQALERRPL